MIKLTDNFDVTKCEGIDLYNPFFAKVSSILNSNGNIFDVLLYEQIDNNGKVTAFTINNSGSFTVLANDKSDKAELADFLNLCSFFDVLSNVELPLNNGKCGNIMKYSGATSCSSPSSDLVDEEELKNIFPLLNANFPSIDDFGVWFADVSHKVRHDESAVAAIKENGRFVSCALCAFISEKSAVINGVCTLNEFRHKGYAPDCLMRCVSYLKGRGIDSIFVLCKKELTNFYLSNGFEINGEWYEYLREI